jgi:hypothetical protein
MSRVGRSFFFLKELMKLFFLVVIKLVMVVVARDPLFYCCPDLEVLIMISGIVFFTFKQYLIPVANGLRLLPGRSMLTYHAL